MKKIVAIILLSGALQINADEHKYVTGASWPTSASWTTTNAPVKKPEDVNVPYELFLHILKRAAKECDFNILDEQIHNLTDEDRASISDKARRNCKKHYGFSEKERAWAE